MIANASRQDIILEFEGDDVNSDELKEAIEDLVSSNGDTLWIEVVSQDDGTFIISVIQTEGQNTDVADAIRGCLNDQQ